MISPGAPRAGSENFLISPEPAEEVIQEETVSEELDEPEPDVSALSFGFVAQAVIKKAKRTDNKIFLNI